MKLSASNAVKLFVVANPTDNTAPMIHSNRINGLLFTRSPSGEISNKAPAYPACVNDGTFEILSYVTPNVSDK
jgi:hypothetical protein